MTDAYLGNAEPTAALLCKAMSTTSRPTVGWLARRRRHIRVRLTVLATGLLAVALLIAGSTVLLVLNNSLRASADRATTARAELIADAIGTDGVDGVESDLFDTTGEIDVVQIVDVGGHVLRASGPGAQRALSGPVSPGARRTGEDASTADGTEYRTSAVGLVAPPVTVVVGAAESTIHRVVLTVASLLLVVFPLLLAVLAAAVYYFVGRTLAPVEHIRAEVAEMAARRTVGRVPIPDTDDEIATLAATMNDLLDRISVARDRQLQFVGDASHELRSPLMTIVGLSDLARTTGQSIDADTVREVLHPEAVRLQTMVDDLLLLARADEHGLVMRPIDVDLDELVSAEARRLEALGQFVIDVDIVPVRVVGDREMLTRAVRNIVDNAAAHARSRVGLSLRQEDDHAVITVADDGAGVPDADKRLVFERFVRLDDSRRRGSGSGLGLAIVTEIVDAHHGAVTLADAGGGGAVVTVRVPLRR